MVYDRKRVNTRTIEAVMLVLMFLTLIAAIIVPSHAIQAGLAIGLIIIIEMLLLVIISLFGIIYLLAKVWELHVEGEDSTANKKSHYVRTKPFPSRKRKKSATKKTKSK